LINIAAARGRSAEYLGQERTTPTSSSASMLVKPRRQGTGDPISRLEDVPPKPRRGITSMDLGDFERHLRSAGDIATSIAKTSENRHNATGFSLRFDDQQSIHNARRDSTEIGKKEATETTESEPLRRLSSQAQRLHQTSLSNCPMGRRRHGLAWRCRGHWN
jgi:hypothetical protein